jgi:hypothetical protein
MRDGERAAGRVVAVVVPPSLMALLAAALGGCAGGPAGHDAAFVRPADRPECQVAAANERASQGQSDTLDYQRCHPGDRLEWSSERRDTIKPEFGGKRDE